jgi:hypothetical protein
MADSQRSYDWFDLGLRSGGGDGAHLEGSQVTEGQDRRPSGSPANTDLWLLNALVRWLEKL